MALEAEIKLKVTDRDTLIRKLEQQGFTEGETLLESDVYFTAEHHDFRKLDQALRIRSVQNLSTGEKLAQINFKGAKADDWSVSRKELETAVADADILQEILEATGFVPAEPVRKQRTEYYSGCMTACVETVEGLGDYFELEILVSEEKERAQALPEISQMLRKLGYSKEEVIRTSYLSMLMEQKSRHEP